ncbi:hypothetical protein FSP39_021610 [Pinctada imbricata]|uniref:Uncharacterized protein n=1 Tax=Pinctada imbricata TaxID=66713 RepID=A0AA88XI57_PINIB|nr:hypothetical protein FSP39_021610 [Pinctada imbricata]
MATAMPSEDDIEEKSSTKSTRYVCPICLESLRTPRPLPCLHIFCEDCLQTFITAAAGKNLDDVACPVCRKQIVAPESGLPYDKWAKSFPINYYLSSPNEIHSEIRPEMESCRFCERSNKNIPAEHYCKNCAEAICEACKNLHQIVPSLKNHNILTLEYYKKNPTIPEIDELCPLHPSKVIEVYCLDHSKMCCSVCFATKHRHCTDVKSIEECAEDLPKDVLKLITTKLDSLLESVEDEIKEKEKMSEKRKKSREEIVVKMTQCIEAAKKNLDILLQQFESDIHRTDSSDESQLQNILKIFQGLKTSVIGDRQMLESAIKYGSKTQVFVALEKVKIQMGDLMKRLSEAAIGSLTGTTLTEGYRGDFQIVEEVCKLKSIGTVHPVSSPSTEVHVILILGLMDTLRNVPDFLSRQQLNNVDPQTIKWVEKWNYKLERKYCYGATVFGKNIAVVTQNKKIVIFNEDGGVLCKHDVPCDGRPADINHTPGDENKFLISFQKQRSLTEYYIDKDKITELGKISLQNIVEGFCIIDDKIVHASKDHVFISKWDGQLKESIPAMLKGNIAFMSGCPKQRAFCHSDGANVFCRKLDQDTVTKIPLSQFTERPRGLGVDFQGNVYVCCHSPDKLLQISHKDHSVRVALEVNCYTIAFHPDGMSFVLIDLDGNLKFYNLSE